MVSTLNNKVFLDIQKNYVNHKWICERAIFAPKNIQVNEINHDLFNSLPGETIKFK